MAYNPPVRGRGLKKSVKQVNALDLVQNVGSVASLVHELNYLKQAIIQTVDRELEKVDVKLSEVDTKVSDVEQAVTEIKQLEKGEAGEDADEQKIADWVLSQIRQPEDGKDADSEAIAQDVLSRLPKLPNEASIVASVLKQIPTPTASLKIIKEELQLDKEALLEEIINSPKLKLKVSNIDGLDATLKVLDRRYIHGGGDTVGAGTGITITNVNGTKVINASGGGSGTVTSVTSADANATVATTTTTPVITIVSAPKLTTARAINGVNFDGTAPITVADATKQPLNTNLTSIGGLANASGALTNNGAGVFSYAAAGTGDMLLAGIQTVTGAKTFNNAKLYLRNVADTFSGVFSNAITVARTWTFPDKDGTVAMTSDLTGGTVTSVTSANTDATVATTTTTPVITIVSAPKLTTARTINGVSFDGTANITVADATKMVNPMTTAGDVMYGGVAGAPTRLANGNANQVLQSNGTTLAPSWTTLVGGGNAQTANPLSQFASTTSLQLAGVLSDETGTGAVVFGTSPVITTPTGIVKGDVGLGSVDNTTDVAKPVSTAQQTALNLKAPIATPVFTTNITTPAIILGATTLTPTGTELNYVAGVTSAIQTQINGKQATGSYEVTTNKDATGGYAGLTLFKINFKNAANTFTNFFTNATTAARTYTFPDKDITVAGIVDITGINSGTNTGDNSTNTLYSGLVSNATHTGDATGATALVVKGINGVPLSTLGTGILKNTTTTGVPSIAVAGDFPTLNQSTSGTSAGITGNLTGEVTSVGMATTLTNAAVIAKVLTGYVSGAGVLAATDSILIAFNKLNGNIAGLTTAVVSEVTNLYFTTARVLATALTGYVSGAGTVASTDTILQAIQKLNGNDALKAPVASPTLTGTTTTTDLVTSTIGVAGAVPSALYPFSVNTPDSGAFKLIGPTGTVNSAAMKWFAGITEKAAFTYNDTASTLRMYTTGGDMAFYADNFTGRGITIKTTTGAVEILNTVELGHATDTTLSRVSAGVVAIEGVNILTTATGLAKAGGVMTAKTTIAGTDEVGATYTPATGAQTVALNVTANNTHIVSGHASGTAITFTVTGATNSQRFIVSVLQGGTTVSTITAWFATIRWVGGTTPTLTATLNKRDTFGFIRTGVNTYDGFVIGQNC